MDDATRLLHGRSRAEFCDVEDAVMETAHPSSIKRVQFVLQALVESAPAV